MTVITKKMLLEAGVHFGHNTRRWNPKMKEYIFESRNNVYIINLEKTTQCVEDCYKRLFTIAQNGGKVLFVGTRKQVQDIIKEEAIRCGMYYVDQRWLGGTLTNNKTIKKSIAKLYKIEQMEEDGTFELLPKKEVLGLKKAQEKLNKNFSGIRDMTEMPQALFVVDPKTEHNAIAEARILHIPVFGLVDTNCDPDDVDFIIPGNDDASRSVKLIVGTMANAVVEGNGGTPIEITFPDEPETNNRGYSRNNSKFNDHNKYNNNKRNDNRNRRPAGKDTRVNRSYRMGVTATKVAPTDANVEKAPEAEKKLSTAPVTEVKAPVAEKKVEVKAPVVEKKAEAKAPVAEKKVEVKAEVVAEKEYQVTLRADKKWQVKLSDGKRAIKIFATQEEASEHAKELATNNNGKFVVFTKDGTAK